MENFNVSDLKTWREKLQLSQKRFAELAKISLTTLRQLELGTHKPQNRTLRKIFDVKKGIESGEVGPEAIKPRRRKKGAAEESLTPIAAPAATSKAVAEPAPTSASALASTPAFISTAAPTSITVSQPRGSVPIQLSNLDLELINRVLNMNGREKLALLEKLI